ncbi:MAG: UDP-glucose 4-epimerase [Pyrinomonadaceae bacterium]|jgi:UDP-glucose 4-epimerase|nr:UDP-glucose 4-epimerase [Pyrinomonadaceae bacterium]
MRVLVTGGAGYIGSVVTEELVRDGHEVVVYDSLYKGHRGAVVAGAEFVEADLMDGERLRRAFREQRTEAVIHMAADSLVGESVTNPSKYYRNNVIAGLALLDAMHDCEVRRLVFSSTAATYGEPEKQPIEESDPTNPTNTYGQTKLAFEHALPWYERAHGIRHASLRYFNAAGATRHCGEMHDPETHLIPIILQAAAGKRDAVEIYGEDYPTRDGTCVRDYIHVVDLARAHILALSILDTHSAVYNLGCGGDGYTVKEVIDATRAVTGREIKVKVGARRPGDPAFLVASSARIKHDLNWSPQFQDLNLIIESAWHWMQSHPDGYAG